MLRRYIFDDVPEEPVTQGALLSVYNLWVNPWRFRLRKRLDGDHLLLARTMAGELANRDNAAVVWERLWHSAFMPSQGWEFEAERHFTNVPRMAHVQLVGVTVTEWLIQAGWTADAEKLNGEVWHTVHDWLRTGAWCFQWFDPRRGAEPARLNRGLQVVIGSSYDEVIERTTRECPCGRSRMEFGV